MKLKECTKCKLCQTRTNVVVGSGSSNSKIMFIGEAPGKNEDLQAKPFVGRAGSVLNEMLDNFDMSRKSVYVTNIVKCRPPDNRDPTDIEKMKCSFWLKKQIKIIKPLIIVTLGVHAFNGMQLISDGALIKVYVGFSKCFYYQWNSYNFGNIKIHKMLHPAATLYNPKLAGDLYAQFQEIKLFMDEI